MLKQHAERNKVTVASFISEFDQYNPFQLFFLLSSNAICVINPEAKIIGLNKRAEAIFGTEVTMYGKALFNSFNIEKQPELQFLLENVLAGEAGRIQIELNCKDGHQRYYLLKVTPAFDKEQNVIGAFCMLIDSTKDTLLLVTLAESEKYYSQLIEFAPFAIIMHRFGNVLFANRASHRLFMQPLSKNDNFYDMVHPTDRHLTNARYELPVGSILPLIELRMQRAVPQLFYVEESGLQIIYEDQLVTLSIFRELSAARCACAKESPAISEKKYRMIADNMTDLVVLVDSFGIIKYASPSHSNALGYDVEQLEGLAVTDYIHKKDVTRIKEYFLKMVQNKESIRVEFRIQNAAGNWLWLETRGGEAEVFDSDAKQYLLVSRDITDRKLIERKLSFIAYHDDLTQLPNRRLFFDRLTQAMLEHKRTGLCLAVIYMDLDKFKLINDNFGHDIGDELLVAFASRVKDSLRDMDTFARFGGDEFVILLPNLRVEEEVVLIAKRILASLQQRWVLSERNVKTTSSMGIAMYPLHAQTPQSLIKQADIALYQAKYNGRNSYELASNVTEEVISYFNYQE